MDAERAEECLARTMLLALSEGPLRGNPPKLRVRDMRESSYFTVFGGPKIYVKWEEDYAHMLGDLLHELTHYRFWRTVGWKAARSHDRHFWALFEMTLADYRLELVRGKKGHPDRYRTTAR